MARLITGHRGLLWRASRLYVLLFSRQYKYDRSSLICRRYDIASYLADKYKRMAKIFFALQLFVAWSIVVLSTLYASWDGRNAEYGSAEGELRPWWVVSDSITIDALGETVFFLTIFAAFLISFESYINAKAMPTFKLTQGPASNLTPRRTTTCTTKRRLSRAFAATGALATVEVVRRRTAINHVGVSHARRAVRT